MKGLFSTSAILCVIALLVAATPVHACDCLLSKNWSNPACKGKVPKLPNGSSVSSTTTNTLGQGQTQTQGQGQTQSASATGGTSNATGGKVSNSGNSSNANTAATGPITVSTGASTSAGGAGGSATGGKAVVGNTSAVTGASTSTSNSSNQGNSHSSATGGAGGTSASESDSGGNSYSSYAAASRIPAATALAGIGITTAGCRFAEGLGVQTMPAGTSVGFSFKDHDCARFQLAQFLYSRGQDIAGDKVLCQISELKDALGADCLADVHQIVTTAAVYPAGERERREARAQWDSVQK
jgi:hypothetical protein